jgi:DHA3 family tetracycline resistance protein-like MFS transporter
MRGAADRVGVLRPLRIRDFRLLWIGMTVSMVGDGIYIIAIALQVLEISNSASALAGVGIAWTLPQVVLMLASGALSDRIDRRRLMIAGDVVRLIAIGAIGALSIAGDLTLPMLYVLVVGYGIGQAIFWPAFSSIVPTIVPPETLVEANSLAQVVRPFSYMLVGPVVGGVLSGTLGPGWAFVIDGASFGFSALMILLMRARTQTRRDTDVASVWREMKEGLRYVRRETWIWAALVGATISLLCTWGPWETLVPYVITNDLGGTGIALGLVFGAGGLGSVVAAIVMGQRGSLPRKPVTVLYLAWAIGMYGVAGFGVVHTVWQAMLVAFVAEGSIAVLVVVWYTLLQRLVPRDIQGRVFSLDWMISIAGVPLSFAIVGPFAGWIGERTTLILAGLLGGSVTLAFLLIPGARDPERDPAKIERLRRDPDREPTPEPTVVAR